MTPEEAKEVQESTLYHFVEKGTLTLTVKVSDLAQADEIMRWMYATDKPMSSELIEVSWDKRTVTKEEAEIIDKMRELVQSY